MTTTETDECPFEAVFASDSIPCALPRGHEGKHDYNPRPATEPVTETPAGTMRRAASLMRERAEEATPGPWMQDDACPGDVWAERGTVVNGSFSSDTPHIASMHPGVALAVADWLDATAQEGWPWPDEAVKVARAYLGETAATTGDQA